MKERNIAVLTEDERGCGYRKEGGLYLMSGGLMEPCGKLPIQLEVCPCCHGGIKPSRGWTWINMRMLAKDVECNELGRGSTKCWDCVMQDPPEKAGLLWVGEKYYPTTAEFSKEAAEMGVSRRIAAIPRGFEIGKTWVFFAHRKAIKKVIVIGDDEKAHIPAIFMAFLPSRIEYVVKGDETEEKLDRLEGQGVALVKVRRRQMDLTECQTR